MNSPEVFHQPEMFEVPNEAPTFEYVLLKGHNRTDRSFKSDSQLRTEYVQLTDELIRQMTEGVKVVDPETRETVTEKPDFVVWLDKSARPVSWLTKELWPILAPDASGNLPPMPQFRFANIDREQWVNQIDPDGTGKMDVNKVDASIIRSLRSLFVSPHHKSQGLQESIDHAESELDGKTVLIVDEVMASGRTLDIASKFFKRAFPKTKVATTHWMGGQTNIGLAQGNADLPVWYKQDDVKGRGVGNRTEKLSQQSTSRTQRLGSWFLSTRLQEPDDDSRQLRIELKQLAEDVRRHELLMVPSLSRPQEDFDERIQRINDMSMEDFFQAKHNQDKKLT